MGALLHLGVDLDYLKGELSKLDLDGYTISAEKKQVSGISGISFDVHLEDKPRAHTSHKEIVDLIDASGLQLNTKEIAKAIFAVIGEAEAAVHDKSVDDVHFHEVGAVDSIVDIVGTAIALDSLGFNLDSDSFYSSSVRDGSGTINCRHGEIPVPAPAVMEILKKSQIRIVGVDAETEMVTPTGIGILEGLKCKPSLIPEMKVMKVGYGYGKRDIGRFNGLRVVIGEING